MRFLKYNRDSDMAKFLRTKPNANHLAMIIAERAKWEDCPITGLKEGQCYLGDYATIGLTEMQYRTAKKILKKIGFSSYVVTNKGTTATLLNNEVWDLNLEDSNRPTTNKATGQQRTKQQASNDKLITKEYKELKNKELKNKEQSGVLEKTPRQESKPLPFLDEFIQAYEFFNETTGRKLEVIKDPAKAKSSTKYAAIAKILKAKYTIEDIKKVILLKHNEWKDNDYMKKYIDPKTLFAKSNFESYIDTAKEKNMMIVEKDKPKPYFVPPLRDANERYRFFTARFELYKPFLNNRDVNTIYRKRVNDKNDIENLISELEQQNPKLLKIETQWQPIT